MSRFIYRPDDPNADEHGLVDTDIALPRVTVSAAPNVISDIMAPTRHMADGHTYDSKSEFRKATRAHGCVEVGTDKSVEPGPRKQIRLSRQERAQDIRRTIEQLRSNNG